MSKHDYNGFIKLKFGPRWKYIACARSFIQNFLALSIDDQTKADKIALAASELLENAVKYACGETTDIYVTVNPTNESIMVEVRNLASAQQVIELKNFFNKIKTGEPLETYIKLMKDAATRKDGKSQLGLARIQYETGGKIRVNITDDNIVTVSIGIN